MQPPIKWVLGLLLQGQSSWGVKLTTHLHLVLYLCTPICLHGMHKETLNVTLRYFKMLLWHLHDMTIKMQKL